MIRTDRLICFKSIFHILPIYDRFTTHLLVCYFVFMVTSISCFAITWEKLLSEPDNTAETKLNEELVRRDPEFQQQLIREKQLKQIETEAIKERESFRIQAEAQKQSEAEAQRRCREDELSRQSCNTLPIAIAICFAGVCIGLGIFFGKRK